MDPVDTDFGVSKGLPGLAEDLAKFIENLAASPLLRNIGHR
ncbi:hypothetical protein [Mycolicibacterium sp. A43C]